GFMRRIADAVYGATLIANGHMREVSVWRQRHMRRRLLAIDFGTAEIGILLYLAGREYRRVELRHAAVARRFDRDTVAVKIVAFRDTPLHLQCLSIARGSGLERLFD